MAAEHGSTDPGIQDQKDPVKWFVGVILEVNGGDASQALSFC